MRVRGALAAAALAALAAPARAWSDSDTQRGYVVTAAADQCGLLETVIDNYRLAIEGAGNFERDGPARAVKIGGTCFVVFRSNADTAEFLGTIGEVDAVEAQLGTKAFGFSLPWGLDRIDQETLPLNGIFTRSARFSGRGVNVYSLDTGIYKEHQQFTNRAEYGGNFVTNDNDTETDYDDWDWNGHGTHGAAIIAGETVGVAQNAHIWSVKILAGSGRGSTASMIRGIQWAVDHANGRGGVVVIAAGTESTSNAVNLAAKEASAEGLTIITAAGNSNVDACTVSPAGAGGLGHEGGVITVAASSQGDKRANFSNWGTCVDIFAPGVDINSAWNNNSRSYRSLSGTSLAAQHVAGVMAVLVEKHANNVKEAQDELFDSAIWGEISDTAGSPSLLVQTNAVDLVEFVSASPTHNPSRSPSPAPSRSPSRSPSPSPTTLKPTLSPTLQPTNPPTPFPTLSPSTSPSKSPTKRPSGAPTPAPVPTLEPTPAPTTASPTKSPTKRPTARPTLAPSKSPTKKPTNLPTRKPTSFPTARPTPEPTTPKPTVRPTNHPTARPTPKPSVQQSERVWTCEAEWRDNGDGCDCDCGDTDPDCLKPYLFLFCAGDAARGNQFCDLNTNTCITIDSISVNTVVGSGRQVGGYDDKTRAPKISEDEEPSSSSGAIAAGVLLAALAAVGSVFAVRRRRAASNTDTLATRGDTRSNSYVGEPPADRARICF